MTNLILGDIANFCYLSYLSSNQTAEHFSNLEEKEILPKITEMSTLTVLHKCSCLPELKTGDYDCQVYLYNYQDGLVFAFRGSESKEDFLTNLKVAKTPFVLPNSQIWETPDVHTGFFQQFDSVKSWILKKINELSISSLENKNKKIIFTGHSLGGALATLATLYFSYQYKNLIAKNELEIVCLTLGSPRVGDSKFVELFNHKIKKSIRYVHQNDIVPCFPSYWRFQHVKGLIWLRQKTNNYDISYDNLYQKLKNLWYNWMAYSYTPFQDHSCLEYIKDIYI